MKHEGPNVLKHIERARRVDLRRIARWLGLRAWALRGETVQLVREIQRAMETPEHPRLKVLAGERPARVAGVQWADGRARAD